MDALSDDVEVLSVGKPLEERAELRKGLGQGRVRAKSVVGLSSLGGGGLGVTGVLFDVSEEPADGLLVIVVALTFDDDLERGQHQTFRKEKRELTFLPR